MKCILSRLPSTDEGTFGILVCDYHAWWTAELPWKNNEQKISCIPQGEYKCIVRHSPKFGKVYWLQNVEDRSYILIHSGNYSGDISKGYKSHVEGCILLGKKIGKLAGQQAVLISKPAIREFMDFLEYKDFTLVITDA